MTRAPLAVLLAVAVLALAAPAAAHHEADPSAPYDFRNAEPSAFGSAALPAYTDLPKGESLAVSVPLVLHPEALRQPAFRYLVGFNLHADTIRLGDVTLTMDGKPVPVERDETGDARQPRFILRGGDLPRDAPVELLLEATATANADGRLHLGVLAIAFDAAWGTLSTRDGAAAQAYAFTLLMSDGHAAAGLAPNFQGEGNSAVALAPLAALALACGLGLRAAWRRLHPAPPKPQKAPQAQPAPVAAPVPVVEEPVGPMPVRQPVTIDPRPVPVVDPLRPLVRPEPLREFTWSEPVAPRPPRPHAFTAVKRPKRPAPAPLAAAEDSVVARPAQGVTFEPLQRIPRHRK